MPDTPPRNWVGILGLSVSVVTVMSALLTFIIMTAVRFATMETTLASIGLQNNVQQQTIDELKMNGAKMSGDVARIREFVDRMERRMDNTGPPVTMKGPPR